MRLNNLGYLMKQGCRNFWNNKLMSFASIGVLLSCLILMGAAGMFSVNMNKIASQIEKQNEIVVFLDDDVSEEQIADISSFLGDHENVELFKYVSKDEALQNQIDSMDDGQALFEGLRDDNPLPDTYSVVLKDLATIDRIIDEIRDLDGVCKVNAPIEIAKMIVSIKHTINIAGVVMVGILLLVSMVIISNTVKITIFSRRKEINIMKFVGATDLFIKTPFLVEGLLIGITAALISHGVVWASYDYLISLMENVDLEWVKNLHNNIIPFAEYNFYVLAGFLGVGCFVGLLGSTVFVRKYLRV
jgi:cell division transport system permease protein